MTDIALARQVILRRFVAVTADVLGRLLTLNMALVAASRLVGTLKRYGVRFGRQAGILESRWGVAVLAVGAKVAVWWLMTPGTIGCH